MVRPVKHLLSVALAMAVMAGGGQPASAATRTYHLQAKAGYISTADGAQIYMWGFADAATGAFRYPGPTIDVMAGDLVVVTLTNLLPDPDGSGPLTAEPVSLVFFGQDGVTTPQYQTVGQRGTLRSLAAEALPGGPVVTYTFTATNPGTYYYQSGTNLHKHIDMGLIGGMIVRPAAPNQAYDTTDSAYDKENLLLMSALDAYQHKRVEQGLPYLATSYLATNWFLNGRSYPDTILPDNVSHLPAQPLSAMVELVAGQHVLFRMVTLDRDMHPFHHHGNHATVVGHNGVPLRSVPTSTTSDLAVDRFTQSIFPGETYDALYTWTGEDLGWDIYGHPVLDNPPGTLRPNESLLGHNAPLPVVVAPQANDPNQSLVFGELYSGSPFLGPKGELPVGHTSFNAMGEHYMMFHSHHEHELQNGDEGPGGLMTHIMIKPAP